jgi:hypothetical protein
LTFATEKAPAPTRRPRARALRSAKKTDPRRFSSFAFFSDSRVSQQADFAATPRFCVAILEVLHRAGDWKGINEHIVLLSKRRAQLKQAVGALVKEAMGYVDVAPDLATKIALIETLGAVTSGKIFVEVEKARLTRQLAKIKEEQGKPEEAAEIMQEVAVETYGALPSARRFFSSRSRFGCAWTRRISRARRFCPARSTRGRSTRS